MVKLKILTKSCVSSIPATTCLYLLLMYHGTVPLSHCTTIVFRSLVPLLVSTCLYHGTVPQPVSISCSCTLELYHYLSVSVAPGPGNCTMEMCHFLSLPVCTMNLTTTWSSCCTMELYYFLFSPVAPVLCRCCWGMHSFWDWRSRRNSSRSFPACSWWEQQLSLNQSYRMGKEV